MPQDAFTIKYVARELSQKLTGGKISKITQPSKDLLTFIIYTEKGSVKLEICLSAKGCRLNIAETETAAPKVAPGFCMLLRKHLQNALITQIKQVEGERIVYFDFDCFSEFELLKMRLYVELMGKYSNAVLVKDGVIVGALKTTALSESTRRVLFTGAKYFLPEAQDKLPQDDFEKLSELLQTRTADKAKLISDRILGVSYATALDIISQFGESADAEEVFDYLNGNDISPCVTFADGRESDFKVRSVCPERREFCSVLEAQTAYYAAVTQRQEFEDKKKKLLAVLGSAIKKLEKRLAAIEQKLFDCRDMDTVKLKGELITANIYLIERGMESFEAVNYYDENCGKIKIQLDKNLSPSDNAQRYFKRYAKLKRTAAAVTEQRNETQERLSYLNSISSSIYTGECLKDFIETEQELKSLGLISETKDKKKTQQELPFREYRFESFKILAGRNNIQNDRLLKSISSGDIWLHTQKYHSSHVAIITDGREAGDGVIKVAAEICAYYSEARGGSKVPVDYTRRAHLKKPPKCALGFVTYTNYQTALVTPNAHPELKEN